MPNLPEVPLGSVEDIIVGRRSRSSRNGAKWHGFCVIRDVQGPLSPETHNTRAVNEWQKDRANTVLISSCQLLPCAASLLLVKSANAPRSSPVPASQYTWTIQHADGQQESLRNPRLESLPVMRLYRMAALLFIGLCVTQVATAQFSPGELSLSHHQLDGVNNCLQCHDAANEITGKKCLICHTEIQTAFTERRGYHFKVSAQQCIACHREHKGRNNFLASFDKKTFDHNLTGFVRTGKHTSIECSTCHTKKNIVDPLVLEKITKSGRQTYRGLAQACANCHEDRHKNTVGTNCQNCHSQNEWSPASNFDHARTQFVLMGKHAAVACGKCHREMETKDKTRPLLFTTMNRDDCAPCHTSPHKKDLATRECSSCHTPEDWRTPKAGATFNHNLAAFKLAGRHANVPCAKCHKAGGSGSSKRPLRVPFGKCTACHTDYHKGELTQKYNAECDKCHTPAGFVPTTFSYAAHSASRFPLTGAHLATPCEKCHVKGPDGRRSFRFAGVMCESCHKDRHAGQFAREMKGQSCGACHTTQDWSPKNFNHAKAGFTLVGKHTRAKCSGCHKTRNAGGVEVAQYKGTPSACEDCHKDNHAGQFASNGGTDCKKCHQPLGWKALLFDHSIHSAFALSGAHKRIECRACHREERVGTTTLIRFKPLSMTCESCHAPGSVGNG